MAAHLFGPALHSAGPQPSCLLQGVDVTSLSGPCPRECMGTWICWCFKQDKVAHGGYVPPWNCPSNMVTIIVTLAKLHPIVTEAGHLCVSLYFLYLDVFPLELLGQRQGREVQGTG